MRARPPASPADRGWVSASDLAEWAYCPRASWYRRHPPPGSDRLPVPASARRGVAFHRRALAAEARREVHPWLGPALLLAGVALLLGTLVLMGFVR
ncbi:MAG: hypothetical protein QXG65_02960 [Thermoplasmata archaeon]